MVKKIKSKRKGNKVWVVNPNVKGGGYWRRLPHGSSVPMTQSNSVSKSPTIESRLVREKEGFGLGLTRTSRALNTLSEYIDIPDVGKDAQLQDVDFLPYSPAVNKSIKESVSELYDDLDKSGVSRSAEGAFAVDSEDGSKTPKAKGNEHSVQVYPAESLPNPLHQKEGETREQVIERNRKKYDGLTAPPFHSVHSHPGVAAPSLQDAYTGLVYDFDKGYLSYQKSNTVVDRIGNVYSIAPKQEFRMELYKKGTELNPRSRVASNYEDRVKAYHEDKALSAMKRTYDNADSRATKALLESMNHWSLIESTPKLWRNKNEERLADVGRFVYSHSMNVYLKEMGIADYRYKLHPKYKKIEQAMTPILNDLKAQAKINKKSNPLIPDEDVLLGYKRYKKDAKPKPNGGLKLTEAGERLIKILAKQAVMNDDRSLFGDDKEKEKKEKSRKDSVDPLILLLRKKNHE